MLRAFTILLLLVGCVLAADAKDIALSPSEFSHIKAICRQSIGVPFHDASFAWHLRPFVQNTSDILQPTTPCDGHYCSWSARLRDGTWVVFTFMHEDPHFATSKGPPDVTPDATRKGNNRYVGAALIRKGKVIFSVGHIDLKTSNQTMKLTTTVPLSWRDFLYASYRFLLPASAYSGGSLSYSR